MSNREGIATNGNKNNNHNCKMKALQMFKVRLGEVVNKLPALCDADQGVSGTQKLSVSTMTTPPVQGNH